MDGGSGLHDCIMQLNLNVIFPNVDFTDSYIVIVLSSPFYEDFALYMAVGSVCVCVCVCVCVLSLIHI